MLLHGMENIGKCNKLIMRSIYVESTNRVWVIDSSCNTQKDYRLLQLPVILKNQLKGIARTNKNIKQYVPTQEEK